MTRLRNLYSSVPLEVDREHFAQDFVDGENRNAGPLFVATDASEEVVGYGRCGLFDPVRGKPIYGLLEGLPTGYYLKGVLAHVQVRRCGVARALTELRHEWIRSRAKGAYCLLQEGNTPSLRLHQNLGYRVMRRGLSYGGVTGDRSGLLLFCDLQGGK